MRFASIGSGSAGNATVVCTGNERVLVDCGFGIREAERRLARLEVAPASLTAILVTHEHSDHCKGVASLSRRYDIPVYMTEGTATARDFGAVAELRLIRDYARFAIGGLQVEPVVVPHDAREPAQFVLESSVGLRLGILTDLGSVTPYVSERFSDCDALFVEANHDLEMLARGPYPGWLKTRVASNWGHLNNGQAARLIEETCDRERLQHLVVGHISEKNNSIERVRSALAEATLGLRSVCYALQDEGFDWLTVSCEHPITASEMA